MAWTVWTFRLSFHPGSPMVVCLRGVLYRAFGTTSATWAPMIRPTGFTLSCCGANTTSSMRTGMGSIYLALAASKVVIQQQAFTLKDFKSGVGVIRPIPS